MSVVVLDASAGLSFLVASQATAASERFRQSAGETELAAPSVFAFEMRHALLKLERRALVGPEALDAELLALESLVAIAPPPSATDFAALVALARVEGLGIYDTAYLSFARDQRCALASRDAMLLDAAIRRGVAVVDLR